MNQTKAIVIMGDFTDEEFSRLVTLVRQIDDQRPDGHFEIFGIDPNDNSVEKAEKLIRKSLPKMEGRETVLGKLSFEEINNF